MIRGLVIQGINNIYLVETETKTIECRVKGKRLSEEQVSYNPLAPGDEVLLELDKIDDQKGQIIERLDRKNRFARYNKKKQAPQIMAANIDLVACLCSVKNPPFRPRFIDRILVSAHQEIPVLIIVNKIDLGINKHVRERIELFKSLSYPVIETSVKTGEGISQLRNTFLNKRVAFIGQSGVGKSSLCNLLEPGLGQKIGKINPKYDRGRHTTCFSTLFRWSANSELIDTPGIREIEIFGIKSADLGFYFPDFNIHSKMCKFPRCTHRHEPDCAVMEAVNQGRIHRDRYESYIKIFEELEDREISDIAL